MADTPDILRRILQVKAREVVAASAREPLRELSARVEAQRPARGFAQALRARVASGGAAVIAEMKRASPSKGRLRERYEPGAIARSYAQGGASALSVLTDREFFQGAPEHLAEARAEVELPILRKDFIVDQYQIYEARALGADAVLLIVAALGDAQLVEYAGLADHLEMDCLVEVHDEEELERALGLPAPVIGVNNRDLRTFETTLETTLRLRDRIPSDRLVVTESGIATTEDVRRLRAHDVHAFLVGEAFMRAEDPGRRLEELFGGG